jgi:L-iditol 2-dehydrogenase
MLAARLFGQDDLRLSEVPDPRPGAGELLLQVHSACVCGTDVRMVQNGHPQVSLDHPVTLGHEMSGVIQAVGEGVATWQTGQRVTVAPNLGCATCDLCVAGSGHLCPAYRALGIHLDGGFATQLLIPAAAVRQGNVLSIPDHVSFAEAALVEPLSCVLNAFERCGLQPGDTVLIIGAGPIGLMHARMTLAGGAGQVWMHDINPQRLAISRQLEPRLGIMAGTDLRQQVHEFTGGRGIDIVITACGAPPAQQIALELSAVNGRIVFFGGLPPQRAEVALNTNLIHYRQLQVTGTTRSSLQQFRRTMRLIAAGHLRVADLVTATYPLGDIQRAVAAAARGDGLRNQIQLAG